MKRILLLGLIAVFIIFTDNVYAELDLAKAEKVLDKFSKKEIEMMASIPEKPYFLLSLEPQKTQWDQYQELRRMWRTKVLRYEPVGGTLIDRSAPGYRADSTLQGDVSMFGRDVHIVYLGHHFTRDGMYALWVKEGEKNLAEFSSLYEQYKVRWVNGAISDAEWSAVRQILGWAQFEKVKEYIQNTVARRSVEANVKYYEDFGFLKKVLDNRAKILDDPAYPTRLDEVVDFQNNLKLSDILPVPYVRPQDFVPDLFIIGPGQFQGGLAYFRLPETEGVVYVSLDSLMYEYVVGRSRITMHEFTHANPYLQNSILGAYFDLEVWDDMATGLYPATISEFLLQPYFVHWRDLVKIYFGYDTDEVLRRLYPMTLDSVGLTDVNREGFEKNAERVEKITKELKGFVEKFLVEFYTEQFFWSAVNVKFCDNAAALRINFALNYEPAGLFDPDKKDKDGKVIPPEVQTREWLMREEEAGRIDRLAEEAMKQTGSKVKLENDMPKLFSAQDAKCPADSKLLLLPKKEQAEAKKMLEKLWEDAKQGDFVARLFLRRATGNGGLPR
ncbi:hypothetical protein A3G55_00970 [Candidatus Giovannonibacteria bacterium RIFCSPLOWO2_12_FULL_44_25]|uniref:DUF4932 domain-containing protein n=3 Tax=Parcubacteria group TaxID=1794811 RepID=A0A837IGJ5_9BACT|nr:MAG: hypothetical protein UW15_C0008G0018 [Parcubacteria group bacterium GW2011_GWC1_44_10]KKT60280.1 MAG: hypothetical protein UW53_C0002G0032 [Candidatus Giovannonibacteria bacterium GW2011_GWA1_44_25]KKU12558.1 MAG: hypothetical protein UX18_C0019G0004 [Candidatus Azambacteria bacterium GW2011_GWC2_45_7b]KKU29692.1 MAG: hypothetical protein UX43_C0007G0034 [Candidatus Giovannonibacteria bacterium GW2011_GWB1_46_20]OGF48993.1 MAG: hypothetical protein A2120_00670 [Candidatus Giovannonibact